MQAWTLEGKNAAAPNTAVLNALPAAARYRGKKNKKKKKTKRYSPEKYLWGQSSAPGPFTRIGLQGKNAKKKGALGKNF